MRIYIPSRGRETEQTTLSQLPGMYLSRTTLVVNNDEAEKYVSEPTLLTYYKNGVRLVVCPPEIQSIGGVRQHIVNHHHAHHEEKDGPKILMLDDDLRFFIRRKDQPAKFMRIEPQELLECLIDVEKQLDVDAHASILAREGGNRFLKPYEHNTRMLRALAYRTDILKKHNISFDRLIVMEDFDVALQLLRLGYRGTAICGYVQDQTKSNAPGGCSIYRTLEKQAEGAMGLKEKHGPFVCVVRKTTKTAWNGATRTDAEIQWKKAFASYTGEPRVL